MAPDIGLFIDGSEHQDERLPLEPARSQYLQACRAIDCPLEAYALWLWLWKRQGGKITHPLGYPLDRREFVLATQVTKRPLPKVRGIAPFDLVTIDSVAHLGIPETDVDTGGCVVVYRICDDNGKPRAWTNRTSIISSLPVYEQIIADWETAGESAKSILSYLERIIARRVAMNLTQTAYPVVGSTV